MGKLTQNTRSSKLGDKIAIKMKTKNKIILTIFVAASLIAFKTAPFADNLLGKKNEKQKVFAQNQKQTDYNNAEVRNDLPNFYVVFSQDKLSSINAFKDGNSIIYRFNPVRKKFEKIFIESNNFKKQLEPQDRVINISAKEIVTATTFKSFLYEIKPIAIDHYSKLKLNQTDERARGSHKFGYQKS